MIPLTLQIRYAFGDTVALSSCIASSWSAVRAVTETGTSCKVSARFCAETISPRAPRCCLRRRIALPGGGGPRRNVLAAASVGNTTNRVRTPRLTRAAVDHGCEFELLDHFWSPPLAPCWSHAIMLFTHSICTTCVPGRIAARSPAAWTVKGRGCCDSCAQLVPVSRLDPSLRDSSSSVGRRIWI